MKIPIPARLIAGIAVAAATLMSVTGCSTQSPSQQSVRLQKAAGLEAFQIDTTTQLWDKTTDEDGRAAPTLPIHAKITKLGNGLDRYQLDGVSLANYLRVLDYFAHGGANNNTFGRYHQAESTRMYNEIAKKLDAVTTRPAAGSPPLHIVVDTAFVGTSK